MTHVRNAALPSTRARWRRCRAGDEHRDPKRKFRRWVAERDGHVVASSPYSQSPGCTHLRKFGIYVCVTRTTSAGSAGAALYERLTSELAPLDPLSLRSHAGRI